MQQEETKSLSTQGANLMNFESSALMRKETREGAIWEVVYGIDKFYMTTNEKDYLLKTINAGARFVEINGCVFTDKFLVIGLSDYAEQKIRTQKILREQEEAE